MARGWESKSVEQHKEEATSSTSQKRQQLTPEQISKQKRQQGLQLSRQHILQQLNVASNPQHRAMLEKALADLDAQLNATRTSDET